MGFLKKIFKGVKKVFSKIGKGIKKVVKKVGKFVNKLGIVGQIGLMFALPAIGGWLSNTVGGWVTALGQGGAISQGVGTVLNGALRFSQTVGNIYSTITGAVTDFIGTAGKYFGSKLPGGAKPMSLGEAWTTYTDSVMSNASKILDPWKTPVVPTVSPYDQFSATESAAEDFITGPDFTPEGYKSVNETSLLASSDQVAQVAQEAQASANMEFGAPSGDPDQYLSNIADVTITPSPITPTPPELVRPTLVQRGLEYARNYPKTLGSRAVQAVEAFPVTYLSQKMQQENLEDYYASIGDQGLAPSRGIPFYEASDRAQLAATAPLETVGWEYYTGAANQSLGGSMTDPRGSFGYSAYQETLRRATA